MGSDEQNYQIAELGNLIAETAPTARVVTEPKEDERNYRVRFDKIRNVLGFRPAYSVPDGIAEIIEAFSTGELTDYRDPRYNNLAFLRDHEELRRALIEDGLLRHDATFTVDEATSAADQSLATLSVKRVESLSVATD